VGLPSEDGSEQDPFPSREAHVGVPEVAGQLLEAEPGVEGDACPVGAVREVVGLFRAPGEPFQAPPRQLGAEPQPAALGPDDQPLQVPASGRVVGRRIRRRVEAAGEPVARDLLLDQPDQQEPAAGGPRQRPREALPELGDLAPLPFLADRGQRAQVGAPGLPDQQARRGGAAGPKRVEGREAAVRQGAQGREAKAG
jgi:hypothetical protein